MKKRIFIAMLVAAIISMGMISFLGPKTEGQEEKDNYFYSGGKKIPIVLDRNRIAVKFRETVPIKDVYSILPTFHQLSAPRELETQDLARANIFLISLVEPLTVQNMQALKANLLRSELVEKVGDVYLYGKAESLLILTEISGQKSS